MEDIGSLAFKRLSDLSDKDWSNILLELRLYAEKIVQKKRWKTPEGILPKGYDGASLASEAVYLLLSGRRKWDPGRVPEVLQVLKGIVRSIASNLVNAPEHEKGPRFALCEDDDVVLSVADPTHDPQEKLEEKELQQWIWAQITDEEEQEVLLYTENGYKPAEIAKETGKPVEIIYQVLRKIKRRLEAAYQKRA